LLTTRHLIRNLRVVSSDECRASRTAMFSLHKAKDRPPIRGTKPPSLIADIKADCVRATMVFGAINPKASCRSLSGATCHWRLLSMRKFCAISSAAQPRKPPNEPGKNTARFVGLMKPWRQARPHWDFAAELLLRAAETREESDIEMATAQMERALRVDGWLCP